MIKQITFYDMLCDISLQHGNSIFQEPNCVLGWLLDDHPRAIAEHNMLKLAVSSGIYADLLRDPSEQRCNVSEKKLVNIHSWDTKKAKYLISSLAKIFSGIESQQQITETKINKSTLVDNKSAAEAQKKIDVNQLIIFGAGDGLSGYFDLTAEQFAIKPQFQEAKYFDTNGLASVTQNGKVGYINALGELVIPYQDYGDCFFPPFNYGLVEENGKWGFINPAGRLITPSQFEYAECFFNSGLARVYKNYKYGYINMQGEIVIPLKFDSAGDFADNGLARVALGERLSERKWGYINTSGEMVISPQFVDASSFYVNGLAEVALGSFTELKWGFINTQGQIVTAPQFDHVCFSPDSDLSRVKKYGKWGYVNTQGEVVIVPQFEQAHYSFNSGLAAVKKSGKWGYVNTQGKFIIPPQFEKASPFDDNGLAKVKQYGKWGLINAAGQIIIAPRFDAIGNDHYYNNPDLLDTHYLVFSSGLAKVKQNGKYGYVNIQGEIIIAPQFEEAGFFSENSLLAVIKQGGKYGYINTQGEIVIAPQFEEASSFSGSGFARVKQNGKIGYINAAGIFVVRQDIVSNIMVVKNSKDQIVWSGGEAKKTNELDYLRYRFNNIDDISRFRRNYYQYRTRNR